MASVYQGRHQDVLLAVKVGEHIFLKCADRGERVNLSAMVTRFSQRTKRKFKTSLIDQQLKITRTL